MSDLKNLLRRLIEIDVFQVGEFRLKSGVLSPIYIDLRGIIAFPDLIKSITETVRSEYPSLTAEVVCGVPYTALPVACLYSVLYNVPMVLKRKEAKDYGTKRMVEGVRKKGQRCLIIEDIVSSGSSVIETAEVLRKEGLVIEDCVVILDRQQGGRENLLKAGIRLHSLFTLDDIFDEYCAINKVDEGLVRSVKGYIEGNKYIPVKTSRVQKRLEFAERAKRCDQPVARRLLEIIARKKSNLCVAVDSTESAELLKLTDKLGPYVCMIKTHVDILVDFNDKVIAELSKLSRKHDFVLFEDRKFADIGNTVKHQYNGGIYNISQWADIVTVHALPGSGIIEGLKTPGKERACVLIAEMSSKGSLTDESYQKKVREMAENHLDFVIGFVAQRRLSDKSSLITFCPGVQIGASGDALGQQYDTPENAVERGADVIIVGRGICIASDVEIAAEEYRKRAFESYMKNI